MSAGCLSFDLLNLRLRLALAAHEASILDFFVLQDVSENHSGHVGIVRSFVVVRQKSLALVIRTLVLRIKAPSKIALELFIIDAFFIHLTQACVVKCLRVVSQNFRIVCVGEQIVPLLGKLDERIRQRCDELIVEVEPIVHAVMSDHGLFRLNHGLDYETEAHFVRVELFL